MKEIDRRQTNENRLANPPPRQIRKALRQAPHSKARRPPRTHPPSRLQRRRPRPRSLPRQRHNNRSLPFAFPATLWPSISTSTSIHSGPRPPLFRSGTGANFRRLPALSILIRNPILWIDRRSPVHGFPTLAWFAATAISISSARSPRSHLSRSPRKPERRLDRNSTPAPHPQPKSSSSSKPKPRFISRRENDLMRACNSRFRPLASPPIRAASQRARIATELWGLKQSLLRELHLTPSGAFAAKHTGNRF